MEIFFLDISNGVDIDFRWEKIGTYLRPFIPSDSGNTNSAGSSNKHSAESLKPLLVLMYFFLFLSHPDPQRVYLLSLLGYL